MNELEPEESMSTAIENEERKTLEPCPFCGAVPSLYDRGDYNVDHKHDCYLALGKPMSQWIVGKSIIAAWNRRQP